jgi:6,7-dimethyl-8-ribityllumazine synthase
MPGVRHIEGGGDISGASIAIVASRYNDAIVERLIQACLDTLQAGGVPGSSLTLLRVPGAFELPVTAARLAGPGKYDAIIALGAVIRGETPHFDYICNACTNGLARVAAKTGIPVIFGVLTVNDVLQAEARSGADEHNKGREAAQSAIEMISLLRKLG